MKDLVRTSFQISQDYYPETMGQVAIINAPLTFTTMWSAIKPWLAKETVEKVDILGSDYHKALLKICDADALPAELGGSCKCEGEGGCARSNVGPWMEDRAERRAAWIKGERKTTAVGEKLEAPPVPATPPHKASLGMGTAGPSAAPNAPLEAAVDTELPHSKEATPVETPNDARAQSPVLSPTEPSEPAATVPPEAATDYAVVEQDATKHEPTVAPVHIAKPHVDVGAAHDDGVERTPVPPAVAPAGYASSPTPPPVDERGSTDSSASTSSVAEPPTPASASVRSARSATSRKSTKSGKSVLGSVFGRRSQSKASRASSKVGDTDDDEDDESDGEGLKSGGERKSRFRATVEKVLDRMHH